MDRRKFIATASAGALTTIVAGCMDNGGGGDGGGGDGGGGDGGGGGGNTTEPTDTPESTQNQTTTGGGSANLRGSVGQTPQGISVRNMSVSRTNNGARATGTIENTGNQTYEELEVQATLFDSTDGVLGRFFDNTEENDANVAPFQPGNTWNFSISFENADLGNAARYRIDVDGDIDQSVNVSTGNDSVNVSVGNDGGNETMNASN